MKRILLVGSQHGNEVLGDKLIEYIKKHHAPLMDSIDFVIGNPRAKRAGIRFIESDMNRSYLMGKETYESRRAQRLLNTIRLKNYDMVVDLHTTVCEQPPCIIVESINSENSPFIRACGIDKVVVMDKEVVFTSLIGKCKNSVCIEVQESAVNNETLEMLASSIAKFLSGVIGQSTKERFDVSLLLKSEVDQEKIDQLKNFELSKEGYIPILVGKNNSYKKNTNYLGFKARIAQTIEV